MKLAGFFVVAVLAAGVAGATHADYVDTWFYLLGKYHCEDFGCASSPWIPAATRVGFNPKPSAETAISGFVYKIDDGPTAWFDKPFHMPPTTGDHSVVWAAVELDGHMERARRAVLKMDPDPPSVVFESPRLGTTSRAGATLEISDGSTRIHPGNGLAPFDVPFGHRDTDDPRPTSDSWFHVDVAAEDHGAGLSTIAVFVDDKTSPFTTCYRSPCRFDISLNPGEHTLKAIAVDRVDNPAVAEIEVFVYPTLRQI